MLSGSHSSKSGRLSATAACRQSSLTTGGCSRPDQFSLQTTRFVDGVGDTVTLIATDELTCARYGRPFQEAYWFQIVVGFLILAGNTGYPIFLRLIM